VPLRDKEFGYSNPGLQNNYIIYKISIQ